MSELKYSVTVDFEGRFTKGQMERAIARTRQKKRSKDWYACYHVTNTDGGLGIRRIVYVFVFKDAIDGPKRLFHRVLDNIKSDGFAYHFLRQIVVIDNNGNEVFGNNTDSPCRVAFDARSRGFL